MRMASPAAGFGAFVGELNRVMGAVNTRLQRDLTLRTRVARRFSLTEVAHFLGVDVSLLGKLADEPAFPVGAREGRERTFSPRDILTIRALIGSNRNAKRRHLHWRGPGEPLGVVTFGAQKGGTGKSLTAAHFAQYLSLFYGLRVGLIDADPQATLSLYFAGADLPLFHEDTATMAAFMGVADPAATAFPLPDPAAMDAMWLPTPWPGVRLIPGGADIQNGDIALFHASRAARLPVYRILRGALDTWGAAHPPRTAPTDLRDRAGRFDAARFEAALTETLDVVVIDQQPSLTLMQLNGLIAADSVVIPQTMKGFDLATLTTYIRNIEEYLAFIAEFEPGFRFGAGGCRVLATIVQEQNDRDVAQIVDLARRAPGHVLKVWYARSDAIANAADEYKSIYEYAAPKGRRASAQSFLDNANAVNDGLVAACLPRLPPRGFADAFIASRWSA
jgi:chromosome partitioning protein